MACTCGAWQSAATTPGFSGGGYLFHAPGHGSASVRWPVPTGTAPGKYAVYLRWTSGPNRAGTAVYRIDDATGTSQVLVDQRSGGGYWHAAGTFTFQSGHGQGVSLSGESDGVAVADAVVFVGPVADDAGVDLTDPATAQPIQRAVDDGDQPWRLDPLEVARVDAVGLGFSSTDRLQLVERRAGAARVRAGRAGATYDIDLIQPARLGPSGIWTVKSIRRVRS
jgi:hypothetical protein